MTKKRKILRLAHCKVLIARHVEPVNLAMGPELVIPCKSLMTALHRTNKTIEMGSHYVAMDRAPGHPAVTERAPTLQIRIRRTPFVVVDLVRPLEVHEH
jgi:hypothetical protein